MPIVNEPYGLLNYLNRLLHCRIIDSVVYSVLCDFSTALRAATLSHNIVDVSCVFVS